jgi:FixJ family two-component response regulator
MTTHDHVVFIVDDDERIREALIELLEAHGIRAVAYGLAGDYVRADKRDLPARLILDMELPDINGLGLRKQIADESHPPIVFITGHGEVNPSVSMERAMSARFLSNSGGLT